MSSISRSCDLPEAACALRDEDFFHDRRVLRAEASRRDSRLTLLEARRRIDVSCADEPQATGTAEDQQDSDDDAAPFTRHMRRRKQQKRLQKVAAPKQTAPFRPPSREPSSLPPLPDYASFRQRHLRYYDSIRHTFISNASSVGTCVDRHANCKAAPTASKDSERPPWNDSTQVSFAPAGFQFQFQLPGSKRAATKAAGKSEKGKAAEVKPNTTSNAPAAQQKQASLQLPDFSFLFNPVRLSLLFPAGKVNKVEEKTSAKKGALASVDNAGNKVEEKTSAKKGALASVDNAGNKVEDKTSAKKGALPSLNARNKMEEKTSAKKGALASVDNAGSASQDIKLGSSMRRHLASKENKPGVGPHPSTKSNVTSKEKQDISTRSRKPEVKQKPLKMHLATQEENKEKPTSARFQKTKRM